MREIELTKGKVALVDDDDFEYLNQWKWYVRKEKDVFYACRRKRKKEYNNPLDFNSKKQKIIRMHRVIMNTPDGLVVDHRNGDGLDNRKGDYPLLTSK